jgi:CBS domain-containing protein
MKLAELLERKGDRAVTIGQTASVAEAIRVMHENRVGSVVIADTDQQPLGIFTERDVMRLCADGKGGELTALSVKEHMTTDLVCGVPDDRVDAALNLMTERRFRRLPIVVDGKLVGVVSIGDLVKAKMEETAHEAEALREYIVS